MFVFTGYFAYSQQFEFAHIDNTGGLSNNQVECIFRDSRNFMWFATNKGLNRYDGHNFKVYEHEISSDPLSQNNKYSSIQEDINGNLWLRTSNSEYLFYDWRKEIFTRNIDSVLVSFSLPPKSDIIKISDRKNVYAYYYDTGIYKYDAASGEVRAFLQSPDDITLSKQYVVDIAVFEDFFWVLHSDGLIERVDERSEIVDIRDTYFQKNFQHSGISKSIFVDADNDLWVYPGLIDKGAACLNSKTKKWKIFQNGINVIAPNSFVRCIGQDSNGLIWIGTGHRGVRIYNKQTGEIIFLRNNTYDNRTICHNSISSILCEPNGMVWIGTDKNGISCYYPTMYKFEKPPLYYYFNQDGVTFDCNCFAKDKQNNLWIGTNGEGLIRFNETTGDFEIFRNDDDSAQGLASNIITTLLIDSSQSLWAGTFLGGLSRYNGKNFDNYLYDENSESSISSTTVFGLAEDNESNIWIGTLDGGVCKLDKATNSFTGFDIENNSSMYSDYIRAMYADAKKNIYFGADKGINIIDKDRKQIYPYFSDPAFLDSLTNLSCNALIVDSRNLLWVATDNGISIYHPDEKRFQYITRKNGLLNEEVVSLVEDNSGNIWAGTRNSLVSINCDYNGKILNFDISVYDVGDGLSNASFNLNAVHKDENGMLYFGTLNGYVRFNPAEILEVGQIAMQPSFTELIISREVIKPGVEYKNRIVLPESVSNVKEITLKHNQTNFSVLFSAFNYMNPGKGYYKYMLERVDNDWIIVPAAQSYASYSSLRSGNYRLVVYAGNNDVWNEEPAILKINVRPPVMLSWWAISIYTLIFIGLSAWLVSRKLHRQKIEFIRAQKALAAEKDHEVDKTKLNFFTNISHEFKTPLTLIITPLEKLLRSPATDEQKTLFGIMYKNARDLLIIVNEILDFRKLEMKDITLCAATGDIISFVKDICYNFTSFATERSIKFTFTTYIDDLFMDFDPDKMKKVVRNLLSNAFKYTREGRIGVSISIYEEMDKSSKFVMISIADTGIGIKEKDIEKIFERFYSIDTPQQTDFTRGGIGLHLVHEYVKLHKGEILVESVYGKGSTFTVKVPITITSAEEIRIESHSGELLDNMKLDENYINPEEFEEQEERNKLPVLLAVDDNRDFCELIRSIFSDSYRISVAYDGQEAYNVVLDELPDIILCDVMMPVMDGYEFCRKIKGDMRTSHIPVILLTAKTSEEHIFAGIEAGADDYITKPFNIDMLKLKVAKSVEKQKNIRQNFGKKIDIAPSEIEITSMDEKFVKKAVEIVEENIGNTEFLIEDLCREMGMSRVYFYKKILALTDKTPSEFVRYIRLKRAADLLEKSQMFVNEVAFQVGFNDPKYFRKYFKEEFGVTPKEYKQSGSSPKDGIDT